MTRREVVLSTETEDLGEGKRVWGDDDESRRFLESELWAGDVDVRAAHVEM